MKIVIAPGDVEQRMWPLEGETVEDLRLIAARNCKLFDHARFVNWLKTQPGDIQKLAKIRPPDRVYRIVSDAERRGEGRPELYGIVLGYQTGSHGGPAHAMIQVLGIKEGNGASDRPIPIPAEALDPG